MVYQLDFHVDGGCRHNEQGHNVIGAAAAVWNTRYRPVCRSRTLPAFWWDTAPPTNQRAELTAVMMAQLWALERYVKLRGDPFARVRIYSDSQYAVNCLNIWVPRWYRNGWLNARGMAVANRDLLEHACALHEAVEQLGSVEYIWIPREQNQLADECCALALDQQE
ncbi:hypothetical protein PG989_013340 [Apiospora arundinis]|uniref:ribonuclease H n=1 Tax=Apiospora arundinis TaxID=335852 RepID=A0ABR2IF61_9PEZI